MNYKKLGNTDLNVSTICLGTMTWGEQNTEAEGFDQMDYGIDHGVNFWDTAELYSVPPKKETFGHTEIIIASLVNIFLKSSMMYFVISILGVLIFVGLTAYDTQKIKNMYSASDTGELMGKKAVMGALTLYLDFINLFIMLLRLFGQRR